MAASCLLMSSWLCVQGSGDGGGIASTRKVLAEIPRKLEAGEYKFVSIKIGVLAPKSRTTGFWLEFDPTLPDADVDNGVRLSTAIIGYGDVASTSFYTNRYHPGCSSMYPGARDFLPEKMQWASTTFLENCQSIAERKFEIKLWDTPSTIDNTMRWVDASLKCYNSSSYDKTAQNFSAMTLAPVFASIPPQYPIHLLDIDAQGADLEILHSVSNNSLLHRVKHIKMECQEHNPLGFMYQSRVANDCRVAEGILRSSGFTVHRVTNNCGVAEFNLYAKNSKLNYNGSQTVENG